MSFNSIYNGKKVIITGNTGFKGSWLTTWLLQLGAEVYGISKDIPSSPSMFEALDLESKITHYWEDIRNLEALSKIISEIKPDFIFHLAAQAIVSTSYTNPLDTFSSNVMGTLNILESLRNLENACTAILITSDKAYDNVESIWGYKENDALGGKDIYSGSKGAAELVIYSYFHSFLKNKSNIKIGIGRAGNVIGGGDWAKDRIVVDCMKAWNEGKIVEIRSPQSTRPWQHVLEPLSGYLNLGLYLNSKNNLNGEAFNFGPRADQNKTVIELIENLSVFFNFPNASKAYKIIANEKFNEANLLKLNCDKSLFYLKWQSNLSYNIMIEFIGEWYLEYYRDKGDMFNFTTNQIINYQENAKKQSLEWSL